MSDVEHFRRFVSTIKAPATADRYAEAAEKFLWWLSASGVPDLRAAPRTTLVTYCSGLVESGYMPATVHMHMAGVQRFVSWFEQHRGEVPAFFKPEMPKNPRKMKDILAPEQLKEFFQLADKELEEPVRSAVMLLPCSGLRGSELAGLPLSCLRRVNLRMSDGTERGVLTIVVKGKGGNERMVPLLNEGQQIIAGYLSGWRGTHADTEWLFPGRYQEHLASRSLRAALQRIREPLGLTFTPHTMRRTYLTGLYRRGVAPEALTKIAGHKKVDTLLVHYLAIDGHDVTSAVHKAGATIL